MTSEEIRQWLGALAPWVAIGITIWLGTRIQAVHRLVNSEMDSFRATLKRLADANEATVFHAGQQNIRDVQKGIVVAAAHATEEAAVATTEAARAVTAAAEMAAQTTLPGAAGP
jgi:hypothetical protein